MLNNGTGLGGKNSTGFGGGEVLIVGHDNVKTLSGLEESVSDLKAQVSLTFNGILDDNNGEREELFKKLKEKLTGLNTRKQIEEALSEIDERLSIHYCCIDEAKGTEIEIKQEKTFGLIMISYK